MKLIYEQEEIQKAVNALNGMTVTGVENARRLVVATGILMQGNLEGTEEKVVKKEEN